MAQSDFWGSELVQTGFLEFRKLIPYLLKPNFQFAKTMSKAVSSCKLDLKVRENLREKKLTEKE